MKVKDFLAKYEELEERIDNYCRETYDNMSVGFTIQEIAKENYVVEIVLDGEHPDIQDYMVEALPLEKFSEGLFSE